MATIVACLAMFVALTSLAGGADAEANRYEFKLRHATIASRPASGFAGLTPTDEF